MRNRGKNQSSFPESQRNSFISGPSTALHGTSSTRSVRAGSLQLTSPQMPGSDQFSAANYFKAHPQHQKSSSVVSSQNNSLIDGIHSKLHSRKNSRFEDASIKFHEDQSDHHRPFSQNPAERIASGTSTPRALSQYTTPGRNNSFRANRRGTRKSMTATQSPKAEIKMPVGLMSQKLDELKRLNRKLSAIEDYDKPVSIIQEANANFARTMSFFNKHEETSKGHINMQERLTFVKSPAFAKYLTILQDHKMPKVDDENFYIDLATKLREEVNKKNRELRLAIEEQSIF